MTIAALDATGAPVNLASTTTALGEVPGSTPVDPASGAPFKAASEDTLEAMRALVAGLLTDEQMRAEPVEVIDSQAASMFLRFFNLFSSPPGYDPSLQRQRITAILESGTVTTVSTVTTCTTVGTVNTVTNMAQLDGVQGRLLAYGADLSAWHDCVRSRIS